MTAAADPAMRILLLSHYFPPESNAPANRTHEHARAWARAGHEVHVVTGFPSHPAGRVYEGWERRWYRKERRDGVHVHRVWTYLAPNRGVVRRALNYLSYLPAAAWRALRLGRFDAIVATSPQFLTAVAGWLTAALTGTPWVFEVRDLWPESIVAVGAVRSGLALRLLETLELRMYAHATRIVCVTRSFVKNLEARGVSPEKLVFIPNGVEPEAWEDEGGARAWRARLGVEPGEVLATYVGTVGMAHGLSTVLDAAEDLREHRPPIRFAIAGDGADRPRLQEEARRRGLRHVLFPGLVPRSEVPALLAATDVSLVLLRDSPTFRGVLPSKMFESMAAGKPVVLGVDGEARAVLEEARAGLFVPPGDPRALARAISSLAASRERRAELGQSGRSSVQREYSRRVWATRYANVLIGICARTRVRR